MLDLLPRIKDLMTWAALGPASFADEVGVARPVMSHILSARNKVSLEVVQKILARFPEVNPQWLLLGTAQMLRNVVTQPSAPTAEDEGALSQGAADQLAAKEDGAGKVQTESPTELTSSSRQVSVRKAIVKVLLFYSDGTFEDYNAS